MPKIVNERYQLVKLCHIDCSGPVFLRRTVYSPRSLLFTQFKRITVTGKRTERQTYRQTYRQTDGSAISIAEPLRRKHLFLVTYYVSNGTLNSACSLIPYQCSDGYDPNYYVENIGHFTYRP